MPRLRPGWARLRRDGDGRWRVTGTLLALLATLVGLLAVLAHVIATPWQPAIVLASGAHYPMWASAVALVVAVLVRRWGTAVVAIALTAVTIAFQAPTWISDDLPPHGTSLVVMQANLMLGEADPAAIVARVRDSHAQVLTTEELTEPEVTRLTAAGLGDELPYQYLVASTPRTGNGIGIWSRYPLSQTALLPGFDLKVVRARVAMPGRAFTLLAVHLLPPFPYDPGEWTAELPRLGSVLRGLPKSTPVIAAGDYNATVDHAQFRDLLDDGYADAADQAGSGYSPTYPTDKGPFPVIEIDHVLTRGAVAATLDTIDLPGSDHRGLVSRVVLAPPA